MNHRIILETERTYLRQICTDDFNALSAFLGDTQVMYAWGHSFSDDEVRNWINENMMRYDRDGYSYWAVILKDTDMLVGVSGIFTENADEQAYIGIGYIFSKAFWHQGFAFECASACKNYAFDHLRISFLTAQIRPDNIPSKNIADKLGMTPFKQFNRIYRGESVSHILYGCSK